jgi:hypothetical protein
MQTAGQSVEAARGLLQVNDPQLISTEVVEATRDRL